MIGKSPAGGPGRGPGGRSQRSSLSRDVGWLKIAGRQGPTSWEAQGRSHLVEGGEGLELAVGPQDILAEGAVKSPGGCNMVSCFKAGGAIEGGCKQCPGALCQLIPCHLSRSLFPAERLPGAGMHSGRQVGRCKKLTRIFPDAEASKVTKAQEPFCDKRIIRMGPGGFFKGVLERESFICSLESTECEAHPVVRLGYFPWRSGRRGETDVRAEEC